MIDARIPLGVQPMQLPQQRPDAQLNMLAQALQLKSGMSQMQEAERERAERNALAEAYKGALGQDGSVDRNRLFSTLASQNLGARIPALQKQFMETDKAQGELQKAAAERYKVFQSTIGSQFNNPNLTKDAVLQSVGGLVESGAFDRNVAQKLVAALPDDPQQLREALRSVLSSQMTPEQMLTAFAPKPKEMDDGQRKFFIDENPNSPTFGKATAGGAVVQKLATPDSMLSAQTSEANNRRSVAAQYDLNRATREAAQTNAQATRDAAAIKDKRDTEMKLADDYRGQSKSFKEVSDAYRTIETALDKATTSPAATLAGATKFMKLLDPGSVVRESELGMALAATGVFDRAMNYVNTLQRGKVLTAQQAADFKNIAGQIYGAAQKQQQMIDANYSRQAQQYGLRPDLIVQDLGQNKPVNTKGAGGREASGKVDQGPSVFDQADAILRGGK